MQATTVAPAAVRPSSTSRRRPFGAAAVAALPAAPAARRQQRLQRRSLVVRGCKVEMVDLEGVTHVLDVDEDTNLLDAALDNNIEVAYDCKMGVCLQCSAKVLSGNVVQPGGMISEECQAEGYALMCVAHAKSDCSIRIIPEEELMDAVMV